MNTTLRALAALLGYPDEDLKRSLPELREHVPPGLEPLLDAFATTPLLELQERYVALFDRSRALSLHLFEHVHGESRDRGQAMVDLQAMYEAKGLAPAAHELPDYLPVFLEYLSLLDRPEARRLLAEAAHILRAIGDRLAERGSAYCALFAALLALAGEKGLTRRLAPLTRKEDERAALDAQWADPEVTFGGPQPVRFYKNGVPA